VILTWLFIVVGVLWASSVVLVLAMMHHTVRLDRCACGAIHLDLGSSSMSDQSIYHSSVRCSPLREEIL